MNISMSYNNSKLEMNNNVVQQKESMNDRIKNVQEYLKQSRINEAKEQIAMFNAIYTMYEMNPSITKKRMYYEAIEKILPNIEIYINTDENGITKLLPLD